MDIRCRAGWHQYAPRTSEWTSTGESVHDIPGVYLECSRCHHSKFIDIDPVDERRRSLSRDGCVRYG